MLSKNILYKHWPVVFAESALQNKVSSVIPSSASEGINATNNAQPETSVDSSNYKEKYWLSFF